MCVQLSIMKFELLYILETIGTDFVLLPVCKTDFNFWYDAINFFFMTIIIIYG